MIYLIPDPLNLVQVVDMKILGSDAPAVNILQPADDFLQWQRLLISSNKRRLGQLENSVQILSH